MLKSPQQLQADAKLSKANELDAVRVTGQSDASAEQVLLVEATGPDELAHVRCGAASDAAMARCGWQVEAYGTYRLMAEFS